MTGFDSKRSAAQDKVNDDAQGYIAEYEAALLISYQQGFADGKRAQRKPLTDEEMMRIYVELKSVAGFYSVEKFARAIEAAHNIKK